MANILVVEDDAETLHEIVTELTGHGHTVEAASDGQAGYELAIGKPFDAITLDRMLPGLDGLAFVERLRAADSDLPVLMISALGDIDDRIAGLRAGGDDYMTKPFASNEMAMRIEVLLRRNSQRGSDTTSLTVGAIHIDLISRQVCVEDTPVRLVQMEFRLLEFLARNAGKLLSRRIIFERVWGYYFDPGANLINVHIGRLRHKLDRPGRPSAIVTVKGEGYRLDVV